MEEIGNNMEGELAVKKNANNINNLINEIDRELDSQYSIKESIYNSSTMIHSYESSNSDMEKASGESPKPTTVVDKLVSILHHVRKLNSDFSDIARHLESNI